MCWYRDALAAEAAVLEAEDGAGWRRVLLHVSAAPRVGRRSLGAKMPHRMSDLYRRRGLADQAELSEGGDAVVETEFLGDFAVFDA